MRSHGPTVAVLITYFNEKEMLRECLESLAAQTVMPDEVLVYDDASPYPAEDYIPAGFPAKVMRGAVNKGPSAGRNCLLAQSSADYVHFHDADDVFRNHWCESIRNCMENDGPDIILSDLSLWSGEAVVRERFYGFAPCPTADDFLRMAIRVTLVPSTGTYRRDFVRLAGGYNERTVYSEDFEFHLRVALAGGRHVILPEPLILQRAHEGNRSRDKVKFWLGAVAILGDMLDRIPVSHHPDVAEAAAVFGADLYRQGRLREARQAFDVSARAGKPRLARHSAAYRMLARAAGQETAEKIGALLRRADPRTPGAGVPQQIR